MLKWYLKGFRDYAETDGRASRSEYWWFTVINIGVLWLSAYIGSLINWPTLAVIYVLVMFIPQYSVGFRRMHDINRSSWYYLIPLMNLLLCCLKGTEGPNKYGPVVLEAESTGP